MTIDIFVGQGQLQTRNLLCIKSSVVRSDSGILASCCAHIDNRSEVSNHLVVCNGLDLGRIIHIEVDGQDTLVSSPVLHSQACLSSLRVDIFQIVGLNADGCLLSIKRSRRGVHVIGSRESQHLGASLCSIASIIIVTLSLFHVPCSGREVLDSVERQIAQRGSLDAVVVRLRNEGQAAQ